MLLAIDVGNTNMVFGIFQKEKYVGGFRVKTDVNYTSDEVGLLICQYFQRFALDLEAVDGVIVASVAPQVNYTLNAAIIKYLGREPLVVGDGIDPGLPYAMKSDERLGADRSVACVSAIEKYGAPLVVLDFGTATTLDAINAEGAYMGGCITAGVRISTEALFEKAAMLPRVELVKPEKAIGTSTVGQMQAGAVLGYIGAMEYLIRATKAEMGGASDIKVVATGGLSRMVADNTQLIDLVDPQLILDGLRILYERHLRG